MQWSKPERGSEIKPDRPNLLYIQRGYPVGRLKLIVKEKIQMKRKMKGVLGVGLTLVLLVSLCAFAIPAAADPGEEFEPEANEWTSYVRTAGSASDWFIQGSTGERIGFIGPIAQSPIDGDLYAYVGYDADTPDDLFKSEDGGRTWATSTSTTKSYHLVSGEPIVDMVCSSMDEDVLYVTDGNYVYKSVDGGETFALLAQASLETALAGDCGCTVDWCPITSIDVGYDANDNPLVFIGVTETYDPLGTDPCQHDGPPSVLFLAEAVYPVKWNDLILNCYSCGGYTPYSIGVSPDFADTGEVFAVVSRMVSLEVGIGYGAVGTDLGTAEWSTTQAHTGNYSAKLSPGATDSGLAAAKVPYGGTLTAFSTLDETAMVFWTYYDTAGKTSFAALWLDTDDDGVADVLLFNKGWSAGTITPAPDTWYDAHLSTVQAPDTWHVYDYNATTGGIASTGTDLMGDPDSNVYHSLTDWADIAYVSADGTFGDAEVLYVGQAIGGVGGSAGCFAYADDIIIDGVTYTLPGETHVVSTSGTICHWTEQAELLWDCVNSFDISAASRIGFPDDWSDSETLFVGVVGAGDDDLGGDVYSVTAPSALDLNVAGYSSGCEGLYHKDIISLDVVGAADDGSLIAGLYDPGELSMLYYSTDGGWEWDHVDKAPSGEGSTYVLWVGDSAIAATAGCECAISLSCGEEVGEYFNQISLIATDVDQRLDMDHAPGYLTGTSTMFEATSDDGGTTSSVWRYDGTYCERVWVSTIFDDTPLDWVQVSPDFDTTEAVFVANGGFDIFRSVDAGCSWKEMRYPCETKPDISAWVVIDEDTLLAGGAGTTGDAGTIFKTTNHGAGPWKEYEAKGAGDGVMFALSPSIDTDDSVLYGDDEGKVFISEDLGEEWDEVVDASADIFTSDDTYVIFDPGYGTSGDEGEFMIYAAAGDTIGRCDIDADAKWSKQDWKAIYSTLLEASGIDAAGDTALYVADRGSVEGVTREVAVDGSFTIEGLTSEASSDITITLPVPVVGEIGTFIDGELVMLLGSNFIVESTTTIKGKLAFTGVTSGATGTGSITLTVSGSAPENFTVGEGVIVRSSVLTALVSGAVTVIPSRVVRSLNPMDDVSPMKVVFEDLVSELESDSVLTHPMGSDDLWLTTRSNVLWALDSVNKDLVWVWEDPLATPVIQETPSDGAQLTSTSKVTLEWEALDDADEYEINLYRYCPQCPDEKESVTVANSEDTCAIIDELDAGSKYYWKVRVALDKPFLSKWSELWEFTTALDEVPYLCSPICGAEDVILTTNFSWETVPGATGYEIEIATNEDFDPVIASGTATVNAWVASPKLDYSTTYYWQVRAVKDGIPGAWSVCIFTTEAPPPEPVEPVEPVVIPPLPAPITPLWIWVIIGIGAALVISVIVLIVTTRRVP